MQSSSNRFSSGAIQIMSVYRDEQLFSEIGESFDRRPRFQHSDGAEAS
jgi:hypothetical protein